MSASVIVCNGCCCGKIEKGHNEVPVDALKSAWEKSGLEENVKLTISGCLGPCNMHNVSLLKTKNGYPKELHHLFSLKQVLYDLHQELQFLVSNEMADDTL